MEPTAFDRARCLIADGAPPEEAAASVVAAMTPDEVLWCLDGDAPTWAGLTFIGQDGYHLMPFDAAAVPRLGVRGLAFSDGPRGAVVGNATAFPVSMARGAAWDPELEERVGEAIGRELAAVGANLTGAVCVNLLRHPAWGRAQETYGEDPTHVGELGAALTRGLQRHVIACVKHFAVNSMENARFSVDVEVDEVALHEVYLPHFRRIIDEGAGAVMSAYNAVNGSWCGESHALLTEVLRDEWGFEGVVISDWIFGLRDAATSVTAGLDVEMPYRMIRAQHLPAAIERGEVTWDDARRSATRVVATLLRFDDVLSRAVADRGVLGSEAHRSLAREVAARSVVVLRNEAIDGVPLLPVAPGSRVFVVGELASQVNLGDRGSSDVWDLDARPVIEGLAEVFEIVDDAADADLAVVVVGTTFADEGEFIGSTDPSLMQLFPGADDPELAARYGAQIAAIPDTERPARLGDGSDAFGQGGDRTSLRLRDDEIALIRSVAEANPRTVVVVQSGSAVLCSEWVGAVPGLVMGWYGGCRAGSGLADVLSGAVNPSARLPFTVPVDEADLPFFDRDATAIRYDEWHGWWHAERLGRAPLFPFGYGLSYTTFATVAATASVEASAVVVRGVVRNTGAVAGADVMQVYVNREVDGRVPVLGGFARVEVGAGAETEFTVRVPLDRLAVRDADAHAWRSPSGSYRLTVGRHAGDPDGVELVVDL